MTETMNFSVREFRHMTGRLLHARACSRHLVNPLRELLLSAQAGGFDALSELERTGDGIARLRGTVSPTGETTFDGGGQPAWFVAPDVIDRLAVLADRAGDQPIGVSISRLPGAAVFEAIGDYARIRGVAIESVGVLPDGVRLEVRPVRRPGIEDPREAEGPAIARVLGSGFDVDVEQFWRLYHESNEALTPDSEVSRQHAGAQVHDEAGNVIGEADEESYLYIRSQAELAR